MAGPLAAPPQELIPEDLSVRNQPNRITRRGGLLQRSYRSQLENGPIRWARTGESSPLYTSVDASRPRTARRYTGGNGGAAGNRTRVRSAYYKRVYRHSPGEPGQAQYRGTGPAFQGCGICLKRGRAAFPGRRRSFTQASWNVPPPSHGLSCGRWPCWRRSSPWCWAPPCRPPSPHRQRPVIRFNCARAIRSSSFITIRRRKIPILPPA